MEARIAGLIAGLAAWTLLEYALHRFVFHDKVLGDALARDHLKHHAKVDWFAPMRTRVLLAVLAVPVLVALPLVIGGAVFGASLTIGLVGGWLFYEVMHRRIHVAAPRNAYGAWARRNHLSHHFGKPRANHGVTSPIWDRVFRTWEDPEMVCVPRLHVSKFPWLLDDGATRIAPRWASDYRVR
jgi:sterol desaturase/sphingolipid hydroxylase (fatty acid hydroxylase superfamily)